MIEYHKIQTVFNRDPETKFKKVIDGDFSLPEFEYLKNNEWMFTEKVDGTNIRIGLLDGKLDIRGRTDKAQIPTFLLSRLMEIFTPEKLMEVFDGDFCLYGEGYGNKIQQTGKLYIPDSVDFILFDVQVGPWWLLRNAVDDIADRFDIKSVPVIGTGTLDDMRNMVRVGFRSQWGDFQAEGIVARPTAELKNRSGKRIITKLKCKDF